MTWELRISVNVWPLGALPLDSVVETATVKSSPVSAVRITVEPDAAATEQAKAAALEALSGAGLRSRYRLALVAAALVAALVATGVTLAASRTAREVVGLEGSPPRTPPAPIRTPLPVGANGFATVIGHRVWVATPNRERPVSGRVAGFELSPNAVYAAAGLPGQLVALDPATLRMVKRLRVNGDQLGADRDSHRLRPPRRARVLPAPDRRRPDS